MKLSLGFSPCPNDTFIFDALVNHKIDTRGYEFEVHLEDVQTLNQWAKEEKLDVSKISYGVLPSVRKEYAVLNSGSALGQGVGPLLISNNKIADDEVNESVIAIPGKDTTAHLLFSLAYPEAKKKVFLRYDEIENFVLENKGLGVIIHENRFTYEAKGLTKLVDLGDYWEKETKAPIPLGGIVIRRSFSADLQSGLDALIKKSIAFAFANYPNLGNFITSNAQEMSEDVMRKHIDLYVNDFSLDLGTIGKKAIEKLLSVNARKVPELPAQSTFVN
ncbi:MAG: 1,4-dihydroxy-6-naphthoate synthase [Bacteroidota bacterium]